MNILIAIDSFKGSLSSLEAGEAVKTGIIKVFPKSNVKISPMADGGEGTVDALCTGMGGRLENVKVTGPLNEPVLCRYGMIEKVPTGERTGLIEMAGAAGLTLVPEEKRNPLITTTYGVGEVIRDAIEKGCRRFVVGIGGSATNDGGVGMLSALGYEFLDEEGNAILPGALGLKTLKKIRKEHVIPELSECYFRVACDVDNPLCGPKGCSAVYGPQKGADPEMIKAMDGWLSHYADVAGELFENADRDYPGTGAAGGMGFAFRTFTNARLEPGVQIVLEETGIKAYIREADLVITGEGKLDGQTVMGKAPVGVASLGKKYGKPVIAFAGSVTEDAVQCNEAGIDAFFPVLRTISTLEQAMEPEQAKRNLSDCAEQVFRLIKTMKIFG